MSQVTVVLQFNSLVSFEYVVDNMNVALTSSKLMFNVFDKFYGPHYIDNIKFVQDKHQDFNMADDLPMNWDISDVFEVWDGGMIETTPTELQGDAHGDHYPRYCPCCGEKFMEFAPCACNTGECRKCLM